MINIGVIGTASIAKRYVIDAIVYLNQFYKLTAIASRDLKKAKELADKYGCLAYGNYDDLISSEKLDAVYIPLPNSEHYRWVKKSLNNNLHVIVEKSLACNLDHVIELNELASEKKLVLIENFQFLHHFQMREIKKVIKENKIGELRNIKASFGFPPFKDLNNIRYKKNLGGGSLLDAGAYPIRISQHILGSNLYVDSASLYYDTEKEVDIWGSALLKDKNSKVTSQISFGFDNFYQNSVEIWGSEGKINANRIFTAAPGFNPTVILSNSSGKSEIKIDNCNHFVNIFKYFNNLISNPTKAVIEYENNICQSRLINNFKIKANDK